MAVKYVKDFDFPASAGFHSAPKHYAKGGAVKALASTMKREMTKSNKLSGNTALPKIADMDVYKQSGGAGTKLMPGYKKGGVIKAAVGGKFVTRADKKRIAEREAKYAVEAKRIAKEEAKPLSRLKKFAETAMEKTKEGIRDAGNVDYRASKYVKSVGNVVSGAKNIAKSAGRISPAGAFLTAMMPSELNEGEDVKIRKLNEEYENRKNDEEIPVTATRSTESVTTPVKVTKPTRKPSVPMSGVDAVIAYNRKNNPDFDASMEREIRESFSKSSEEGMKRGGKVQKRNMGGAMMAPQGVANARIPVASGVQRNPRVDEALAKGALARAANMPVQRRASGGAMMSAQGTANAKVPTNPGAQRYEKANPKASFMKHGGKAKYAEGGKASMSDRDAALAKRGIDPYEDRTRGLGPMTDKEAEEASKELRQKYGKKDESVKHPGGRQRFLSGQSEKTPMKNGGKAEASKSDMQQDRAMMARHNRLMHPGQKSKLAKGGVPSYNSKPMIKKAGGGGCNY